MKKIGGENPFLFKNKYRRFFNKKNFEKINYFVSGRNAILEVIKNEKIKFVFIPRYYCYPVYKLIASVKGLKILNYGSKYELFEKLAQKDNKNKILIIIIFFNGMRISINEYIENSKFRNKNIIKLIDSAMTASLPKINFEYDYLITNPRKFYCIPIGSFLFNKRKTIIRSNLSFNFFNSFLYLSSKITSRFFLSSRISFLEKIGLTINNYSEKKVPIRLDIISFLFIKKFKILDLSALRIEQYNIYFERLKPIKDFYFFENSATNMDCPFGFILKIKERDNLRKFLNNYRIFPSNLWEVPLDLYEEIGYETISISKEILLLPIGDQYNSNDIKKVCDLILKFFNNEKHL